MENALIAVEGKVGMVIVGNASRNGENPVIKKRNN